MVCKLEYDCGCWFYSLDDDKIELMHACTDHKIILANDAFANFSKRVKLGSSVIHG